MKGITIQTLPSLKGNNFVLFGKLIYLSDNFTANNWQTPKGTAASSLMHENWHVFSGFSTYLPGGRVGKLIGAVGAESSNLFQFTHNSLQIDDIYFLNIGDNGYGNTSPADYFAAAATALIFDPNHSGVPFVARELIVDMIIGAE